MRYGTMERFSQINGLQRYALRDFLRNRSSTAKFAVAQELGVAPDQLIISKDSTNVDFYSSGPLGSHRQNAEAK
ncbi:MAG: hypothetical protein DI547_16870 [Sphingobium sp.]|nr:MAG: hypothetical protein DI547_16870 [Sphingobium sp.]